MIYIGSDFFLGLVSIYMIFLKHNLFGLTELKIYDFINQALLSTKLMKNIMAQKQMKFIAELMTHKTVFFKEICCFATEYIQLDFYV